MAKEKVQSAGKVVEDSISEYGHYVLEERALADLRDGYKPVQRRLLWTIWERLKLRPGGTSKRSARVTGDTVGCFHPHGDQAAYGSLVNMTWNNYPVIQGEGNFGDPVSKEPPAAYRYTGVKATNLLREVFRDVAVAPMEPNYSGEMMEPRVLTSRLPSLLLNGSEGIAVGVTSNIPPHNLGELLKAALVVLKNPVCRTATLMKYVQGPDYQEGGKLLSKPDVIRKMYDTGVGTMEVSCLYSINKVKNGYQLLVKGAAPNWNLPKFVERCQAMVHENLLGWVSDESGKDIKVTVFSRERDRLKQFVVPLLRTRIRYNWVALDDRKPIQLTLKDFFVRWLNFRRGVVKDALNLQLKNLRKRLLEERARLAAIQHLDETIKAVRDPKPISALKKVLGPYMLGGKLSTYQAKVILGMALRTLTRLGEAKQAKLVKELVKQKKQVLADLQDIDGVVRREINEIVKKYAKPRSTVIA